MRIFSVCGKILNGQVNLNTVTLWAMWNPTVPATMQGFGDYCKNMVQDNGSNGNSISITLRDIRDNNTYTVAKLKDGRCWMTQNLKIQDYKLTSADSNVTNEFQLPQSDFNNFSWYDNGGEINKNIYIDASKGGYYSYIIATAGQGTIDRIGRNQNTTESICPRNWRMPSLQEFDQLVSLYPNDTGGKMPANFSKSGRFTSIGTLSEIGTSGSYWSSSVAPSSSCYAHMNTAHHMIYTGSLWTTCGNNAGSGFHIRCITE